MKCLAFMSVTSCWNDILCTRWSLTFGTTVTRFVHWTTSSSTWWPLANISYCSVAPKTSVWITTQQLPLFGSSIDSWASLTWGPLDPDIAANQIHPPVPAVLVNLSGSQSLGYNTTQRNLLWFHCKCRFRCVPTSRKDTETVICFAVRWVVSFRVSKTTTM